MIMDAQSDTWLERVAAPWCMHRACSMGLITVQRKRVVPQAQWRCTGAWFWHWAQSVPTTISPKVERLIAVEPNPHHLRMAQSRVAVAPFPLQILELGAEQLPLPNHSIDTVLATYSFCSIPDAPQALAEARRVLKPGGRLLFSDHGRASGVAHCASGKTG